MHLDEAERKAAMSAVAGLVRAGGVIVMSLRHGPVPDGRRMFDVSADETIAVARKPASKNITAARSQTCLAGVM
ncbi:hypothetical protein D7S65_06330 [Ralstonia insidiosa]|nr:hypothetical protein [Ralstonia insidiosa]MBA9869368.1 hypothetical protein [Ralstonia insidiosa]MBA9912013.1 hypothetical protein [Ralstonia insidiosa]MBA9936612.1 hypothetical protein [Ralstonia insidiosa]MBA9950986.1 hypothetical protein [Ralstonia insidiosa]